LRFAEAEYLVTAQEGVEASAVKVETLFALGETLEAAVKAKNT
jgi:hypothetical protein